MSAAGCYVIGSVILFVGTIVTNGPVFLIVASGFFLVGSVVAAYREFKEHIA